MKIKTTILFCYLLFSISLFAQNNSPLHVEQYQLENGLTVFLNADPSATKIFGAVAVNAGGKNDPADATGIAHYLEHLLFKGTTEMGTINYAAEKPHLDSINMLYDELAKTASPEKQKQIQQQINQQAVAASKYSLPNELDNLLKGIGSSGVNAFTTNDMTFYHNSFPPSQILKWLEIYSHRFQHPVFRSFQSELEVVYEEKNRAMDNFQNAIFTEFNKALFAGHPYGTQTVLGSVEHLKRPSLTKMYEFFKTYYVANNMALILCGNFDPEKIKPLIKEKFGVWKSADLPAFPNYPKNKFTGRTLVKTRLTPIKVGLLGFKTVPNTHPDNAALEVFNSMLYNDSETGLLNKLQLDKKILYCGSFPNSYNDDGSVAFFFVPKIIGQSLSKAEKMILKEIEKIKTGAFEESKLEAIKNEIYKNQQMDLESLSSRGIAIGRAFNEGISWETAQAFSKKISAVTKAELMRVANQYFGKDYLAMYSHMGFPKKAKLDKPAYKPVQANQSVRSDFAKKIEKINLINSSTRFLDFEKSAKRISLGGESVLYVNPNPLNDIYSLTIKYHVGRQSIPDLNIASNMMNYVATASWNLSQLKEAFAKTGTTYYIDSDRNSMSITLDGLEAHLADALSILNKLLTKPKASQNSLDLVVNDLKTQRKLEKRSPAEMGRILRSYATYGKESFYLQRHSVKEVKKLSPENLSRAFQTALNYACTIHYTGQLDADKVKTLLEKNIPIAKTGKKAKVVFPNIKKPKENIIYFVQDKKAVQSQVYFYVPGNKYSNEQYIAKNGFNTYFGDGFSGLVLQEIREYRSLAYSAWGRYFNFDTSPNKSAFLWAYIGCQADKTIEAIEVMNDLLKNLPEKKERLTNIRSNLKLKAQSAYPGFRKVSQSIEAYKEQGFDDDPNRKAVVAYDKMSFEDIMDFYQKNIKGKAITIAIYGNKKKINLEKLKAFGKLVELDKKEIRKE